MAIWAGLDTSGDVDVAEWARFGVTISDSTTDETNIRARECLEAACMYWERMTGRTYGRTSAETRPVSVSALRQQLRLPVFQSVSSVSRFQKDGTFEVLPSSDYAALKTGFERGTYDTLYHSSCWYPGLYQVEAVWGEAEAPAMSQWGAVKLATYNYKTQTNPSGVGVHNALDGGVMIENEQIPGLVYKQMMSDKVAASVWPRSN